ncbi:hypothetical protein MLD52_15755 [Puniceicoccaceae bacterium K14]|nr:hypothetical protein [Puniceicoccaceae bacterium K14]
MSKVVIGKGSLKSFIIKRLYDTSSVGDDEYAQIGILRENSFDLGSLDRNKRIAMRISTFMAFG